MSLYEDVQLEIARTMRELHERVIRKIASGQKGELFDNRNFFSAKGNSDEEDHQRALCA